MWLMFCAYYTGSCLATASQFWQVLPYCCLASVNIRHVEFAARSPRLSWHDILSQMSLIAPWLSIALAIISGFVAGKVPCHVFVGLDWKFEGTFQLGQGLQKPLARQTTCLPCSAADCDSISWGSIMNRNLVQFYGACIADGNLMLVLEYMDGASLLSLLILNNWVKSHKFVGKIYAGKSWEREGEGKQTKSGRALSDLSSHLQWSLYARESGQSENGIWNSCKIFTEFITSLLYQHSTVILSGPEMVSPMMPWCSRHQV